MNRATLKMRYFAKHLIACETTENKSSRAKVQASFLVTEKLCPHLSILMGNAGFRALLLRALVLANAEFPWLHTLQIKADGSLEGLDKIEAQVEPEELANAGVVLLAQLLGLLVAFIGENLTLHLMHDVWSNLALNDLNFSQGDEN